MHQLKNISVALKLKAIAIGIVIGFLFVSFAFYNAVQNHGEAMELEHHEAELTAQIGDLRYLAQTLRLNDYHYLFERDVAFISEHKDLAVVLSKAVSTLEQSALLMKQGALIDEMHTTVSDYQSAYAEIKALGLDESVAAVKGSTAFDHLKVAENEFDLLLAHLSEFGNKSLKEQWELALKTDRSANWVFGVSLMITSIALFFLTVIVYRSVIGPLKQVERIAYSFAKGDFDQSISDDRTDELGKIAYSNENH